MNKSAAAALDGLTKTFERDQAYCNELLQSIHAGTIAELILYHLWMVNAGAVCQRSLTEKARQHFAARGQSDLGVGYTLLCSEGMKRDMCLVPYMVIRGLPSEAGMALRRAFEHTGVLAHIWNEPDKVAALENVDSRAYRAAFRKEFDSRAEKRLKSLGLTKRFEVLKFGKIAARIYDSLSEFDIHGGTGREIEAWVAKSQKDTCSFCSRSEIGGAVLGHRLEILTSGHKLLCAELVALSADFCSPSKDLAVAAKQLSHLESNTPAEVTRLLTRLSKLPEPQ